MTTNSNTDALPWFGVRLYVILKIEVPSPSLMRNIDYYFYYYLELGTQFFAALIIPKLRYTTTNRLGRRFKIIRENIKRHTLRLYP